MIVKRMLVRSAINLHGRPKCNGGPQVSANSIFHKSRFLPTFRTLHFCTLAHARSVPCACADILPSPASDMSVNEWVVASWRAGTGVRLALRWPADPPRTDP
jgi:hypothetical protein